MESPSSAIPAGDGVAANREKASLSDEKNAESHPLENGWHGYEFMKNGKPRPSAVRDFPEGIVPLHLDKQIDAPHLLPFPEKKKQTQTSPTTSEGKVEHKQTEESMSASATEEGTKLDADSGKCKEVIRPALEPPTDQKLEKALSFTKRSKAALGENKNVENASPKSSKLVEKKTTSTEPDASKQEAEANPIKGKVTLTESAKKKPVKSGEKKVSASDVPQEVAEARSGKKEVALVPKTQKVATGHAKSIENKVNVTASSASALLQDGEVRASEEESIRTEKMRKTPSDQGKSVEKEASAAPLAVHGTEKAELNASQGQREAMDIGKKQAAEKVIEQQEKEKAAEKVVEQSKEARRSVKRKSGIRDMPESLAGPSNQGKSVEKEASVAPSEVQGTEQLNVLEGQSKAMDVEKEQEEEPAEKVIEQQEEKKAVEKVVEQHKKAQPVKRKSGIRDLPDSLTTQAKKKVAKEGVGQEHLDQELEMEVSPSKATETAKEKKVANNAKLSGNAEADNAKSSGNGKKKRSIEEPNSSEKSKKLPKLKPTNEAQTPAKAMEAQTLTKAKEKEPSSKTQGQVVTPKSTKKPSTPSESSKKVRRSAGKSVRPKTSPPDVSNARKLIVESLRLYDAVRRKLVQDEEKNGKQGRGSRADLQAATLLKDQNASRGNEKGYGALPGVIVGDMFLFRTELSFARVHGPIQGGIEYLTTKDSEFSTPVAISIISNVGQDGEDNGEELVYTGQGGRSADNKQIADQKLERGNLAMDGSRKFNIPVRVIRGIKDVNSPTGKIYMYDGLYDVQDTYTAKGSGGFDEFKFRLQRRADQPELGSDMLKLAANLKSQAPSSRKDLVIADISKGKESQAICVENTVDDDKGPADFQYATKVIYPKDLAKPESSVGCKCHGACTPSSSCSCFTRNRDELPYLNGGYLVREKDFIYECGSNCSCPSSCRNRASVKGLKFRLDVFKTTNRGWGVRSLEMIPAGSFVCEYIGKMVADEQDAKEFSDRKHVLFTRWLPETTPRWGDVPSIIPDRPSSTTRPDAGKPELIIDASHVGNVARFINHSCSPNLLVQKVLSEHEDVRYPQFKLFAVDNIPPLRELTFDYGYPPDQEPGTDQIDCLCGSPDCRGKLYV